MCTLEPVLRDHCHETTCLERTHFWQDLHFNITIWHQRPPVLRDHFIVATWVVFQDGFYCNTKASYDPRSKLYRCKVDRSRIIKYEAACQMLPTLASMPPLHLNRYHGKRLHDPRLFSTGRIISQNICRYSS